MTLASSTALLQVAILLAVPIIWAAMGELIIERAGVLNISIEGVMLFGCFATACGLQLGWGLLTSLLFSIPVGLACGFALSWLYIYRYVNQIVGGILFNLLALGVTSNFYVTYFAGDQEAQLYGKVAIPFLSEIPLIGAPLFNQPVLVYVTFAAIALCHLVLFKSWWGLHVRAVGEEPAAVRSAGVDVRRLRTSALVAGSVLIAFGGGAIVALEHGQFSGGMTAGKGYIALAIVMVARWRPWLVVPAALLFALAGAFQYRAQMFELISLPPQIWAILPYLLTIVALTAGKAAVYPRAIATPFIVETSSAKTHRKV